MFPIAALVSLRQMFPGLLALLRLQAVLITLMGTAAGISIDRRPCHKPKDGRSTTRGRGEAATSTCIWITQTRSLPLAFWTPAVERCAIRWNPAQHRPHYPACRPPTSACGSKSKLHALASCCGLRVRGLVSMPGRHGRLHHDRRPARARRRQNGPGLSLL